jgi:hypothetical protein
MPSAARTTSHNSDVPRRRGRVTFSSLAWTSRARRMYASLRLLLHGLPARLTRGSAVAHAGAHDLANASLHNLKNSAVNYNPLEQLRCVDETWTE